MRKLLLIMGLLAISHLASFGAPVAHPGFSADSTIDISFPQTNYPVGSQAVTATVTVNETNGRSGDVTVTGPGTITPSTFALPDGGSYQKSVSVTLPTAPGTYTYTATIGRIDGTTAQDSETITVYKVNTVSLDSSAIMSGALAESNHQCTVTVTVTPTIAGAAITLSLTDNSPATTAASLSSTSGTTDATGTVRVTLTSSNTDAEGQSVIVKAKATDGNGTDEQSATCTLLLPDNEYYTD